MSEISGVIPSQGALPSIELNCERELDWILIDKLENRYLLNRLISEVWIFQGSHAEDTGQSLNFY